MTAARFDVARLKRIAPYGAPVVLLSLAWWLLVQPRVAAWQEAGTQLAAMEAQLDDLSRRLPATPAPRHAAPVRESLTRRVSSTDPLAAVTEYLAVLAAARSDGERTIPAVANLAITTGEDGPVSPGEGGPRPRVSSGNQPDPRISLLAMPLLFTELTVSFEASYDRTGQYLWDLRRMPTVVEIHRFKLEPASDTGGLVRATIVLFAYRRAEPGRGDEALRGRP